MVEERIEVSCMIGEAILNAGFSRLSEPDEIGCDAMRHRRNQRKDIPPYVRRGRVAVQKERDRFLPPAGLPIGDLRTEDGEF